MYVYKKESCHLFSRLAVFCVSKIRKKSDCFIDPSHPPKSCNFPFSNLTGLVTLNNMIELVYDDYFFWVEEQSEYNIYNLSLSLNC